MKKTIVVIIGTIIIAGGSFFAGIKFNQHSNTSGGRGFANLSPEERQARIGQFGGAGGPRGIRNGGGMGGFSGGEVIAKDDKSITVKLRDGGSKIIFFSGTTQVMKAATGTMEDIAIGAEITAMGSANQDGSISAQSIQVRPNTSQGSN